MVPDNIAELFYIYKSRYGRYAELLVLPAIVGLVALTAFGLGRISATAQVAPRLTIVMPDGSTQTAAALASKQAQEPVLEATPATTGKYVGSKSGTKYYLPTCSGVSRIKEANKVWFATIAEAEAAGYTPAANCPGL